MRRFAFGLLLACYVAAPVMASAQEEEEVDLLGDEDVPTRPPAPKPAPAPVPKPATPPPATPPPAPVEDLLEDEDAGHSDTIDEDGQRAEDDLLGDDRHDTREEILVEGADNAAIYRSQQTRVKELPADEEVMSWEQYLEKYPKSVYRERIAARIDDLLNKEYHGSDDNNNIGGDADQRQILLAQSLDLANLNPRTKIQGGFQFGFPGHFGGNLDYEHAVLRNVSVHGGVAGRFTGWGLELGSRYAFVKSTKAQLLATLIVDLRMNFNPVFFQVRPQLGIGKIIGPAQIQATFGAEIGSRKQESVAVFGGGNVTIRVAKPIGIFIEDSFYLRDLTRDAGIYAFNTVSLGIKLYPSLKKRMDDPLEISAAGTVPAGTQYLQYYYGAVGAQGTYYFPEK